MVNGMLISDLINLFRRREDVTLSDKAVSLIFKIATFAFRFFDGTLLPSLSSCLYVHTPSRSLRSSSDGKKTLFPVEDGNSRVLIACRSLFRSPFLE